MTATQPSSPSATLYDTDYMQWITTTVEQLRSQNYAQVDWFNVIEEIECEFKLPQIMSDDFA